MAAFAEATDSVGQSGGAAMRACKANGRRTPSLSLTHKHPNTRTCNTRVFPTPLTAHARKHRSTPVDRRERKREREMVRHLLHARARARMRMPAQASGPSRPTARACHHARDQRARLQPPRAVVSLVSETAHANLHLDRPRTNSQASSVLASAHRAPAAAATASRRPRPAPAPASPAVGILPRRAARCAIAAAPPRAGKDDRGTTGNGALDGGCSLYFGALP